MDDATDTLTHFPQTFDCNGVEITFYSKSVLVNGRSLYLAETPTMRTVAFFEKLVNAGREAVANDIQRALRKA